MTKKWSKSLHNLLRASENICHLCLPCWKLLWQSYRSWDLCGFLERTTLMKSKVKMATSSIRWQKCNTKDASYHKTPKNKKRETWQSHTLTLSVRQWPVQPARCTASLPWGKSSGSLWWPSEPECQIFDLMLSPHSSSPASPWRPLHYRT